MSSVSAIVVWPSSSLTTLGGRPGPTGWPGGYWVAELLRQVRAAEAVDPEGRQWPRTKRSDDATAVYLVLSDG